MAVHFSHAALPYPVKHARYTIAVPYLDADGDPLDPTTPDTEFSLDNVGFADCAEEAAAITGSAAATGSTAALTPRTKDAEELAARVAELKFKASRLN